MHPRALSAEIVKEERPWVAISDLLSALGFYPHLRCGTFSVEQINEREDPPTLEILALMATIRLWLKRVLWELQCFLNWKHQRYLEYK